VQIDKLIQGIPAFARDKLSNILAHSYNPKVITKMLPSVIKGLVLKQGKQGKPVLIKSGHKTHFDFNYGGDFPEMHELYRRAIKNQWSSEKTLDWSIDVDPENTEKELIPDNFCPFVDFENAGFKLNAKEKKAFKLSTTAWMISQFLHGEQGALFASAQVTEAISWYDGKLFGSSQVMDEGRHVEVFLKYLRTKLNNLYQINDNLFVIIDQLMTDSRWDMKFLGMQIMVEGLALGAFSNLYHHTKEPLLKELLRYVIQDEVRHVQYGVLALKNHFKEELNENERREREDWAFEVSLLMKNRFLVHEVYDEWFAGRMKKKDWNNYVSNTVGMRDFRNTMFKRLIPNLKYIGLLSPRIIEKYQKADLISYQNEKNSSQITFEELLG
jgi:hypothetical protein